MLTRVSTISHRASGVALQTPLLIPSFSSKGFARTHDGKSEIGDILAYAGEFLTEAYLISAYDIHYGHIPKPSDLPSKPDMLFLDSGGYETSTDRDYSSVIDPLPAPEPWSLQEWESVISSCPDELALVVVSYDHHRERVPFRGQVELARRRFLKRQHLRSFLLKPETDTQTLLDDALNSAIANVSQLRSFDMIGVTEKELGRSMLDRMVQVARLRRAMDEADVRSPIHVFGALDPLTVCLYYLAGAEIFDGLTWIRYAYENGRCVYTHNLGVLNYGLDVRDNAVKRRALTENCYCLHTLQRRLREFEATKDFGKLAPHSKLLADACDSLNTRLKSKRKS